METIVEARIGVSDKLQALDDAKALMCRLGVAAEPGSSSSVAA